MGGFGLKTHFRRKKIGLYNSTNLTVVVRRKRGFKLSAPVLDLSKGSN